MALNKENQVCQKISSEVKDKFLQIYEILRERETQILRQVEVLVQHYNLNNSYDKRLKQISVTFDNELDLITSISNFGRLNLNGISQESNLYKIEHYQDPNKDHEQLHKNVVTLNENEKDEESIKESEELTMKNENLNQSPVSNVILECIEKQDPSLCQHQRIENMNSSCCSSTSSQDSKNSSIKKFCDTINSFEDISYVGSPQSEQVQSWMNQIIKEPEFEPHPSVMEHSQIIKP